MRLLLSHPSSADANAARSADVSAARASDRKADVARTRRQSTRTIDLAVPTEAKLETADRDDGHAALSVIRA